MEENTFQGEICNFTIREGILFGYYKVETVDLNAAKIATKDRISFTGGIEYPTLADITNVKVTTKEARDFFTQQSAASNLKAIAVLINSPVGKIIGNFFTAINKPPYPFKIFTEKELAVKWLKQYI